VFLFLEVVFLLRTVYVFEWTLGSIHCVSHTCHESGGGKLRGCWSYLIMYGVYVCTHEIY